MPVRARLRHMKGGVMNKRLGVLVSGLFLAALAVAEIGNAATGLPRPQPGPGPCVLKRTRTGCAPAPRTCGEPASPRCTGGSGAGTGTGSGGGGRGSGSGSGIPGPFTGR